MAEEEKKVKMAVIAGASHALKYKEENPRASDQEIINFISKESRKILSEIDV